MVRSASLTALDAPLVVPLCSLVKLPTVSATTTVIVRSFSLGRHDFVTVPSSIADKHVLITGGTGSFGHKMAKRLLDGECASIRILSRDEAKQHHMRLDFSDSRLEFHVGDVRDRRSVDHAMQGVDLVFHAAALKQVPSCEFFPIQAVMTNVMGSANVIDFGTGSWRRHGRLPQHRQGGHADQRDGYVEGTHGEGRTSSRPRCDSDTTVCSVRYGNVMYSRGVGHPSVVQQIRDGMPLTITNPAMTRFLLPLEMAVELVESAFRMRTRETHSFVRLLHRP